MHNIENIHGLLSIVEEKKLVVEVAKFKWLEAIQTVDSAVRAELNHNLDVLKNKQYIYLNPVHFGLKNCLVPKQTGDNFKLMRFVEPEGDGFVLSPLFPYAFQFKGSKIKEIFRNQLETFKQSEKSFDEFLSDDATYLCMVIYTKCGITLNFFDNIAECIIIKL